MIFLTCISYHKSLFIQFFVIYIDHYDCHNKNDSGNGKGLKMGNHYRHHCCHQKVFFKLINILLSSIFEAVISAFEYSTFV